MVAWTPGVLQARVALVLLCSLIFYLSSNPAQLPSGTELPIDKIAHLLVYGMIGWLAWHAQTSQHGMRRFLVAALFAAIYGLTDEWHQSFVPQRMASFGDLVADTIGGLLGAAMAAYAAEGRSRRLTQACPASEDANCDRAN